MEKRKNTREGGGGGGGGGGYMAVGGQRHTLAALTPEKRASTY